MRHLTIADDVDRQTWMHEWEWDASHNPLPLSPAFGSVYPGWMEHALHRLFAEFGMLPSGIQMRLQNGYVFTRVRPSGLPLIPPAWVLRHAMRVWWLHPTIRARVLTAIRRVQQDHAATLIARWQDEWRSSILTEQRALRAVELGELSDGALAGHVAEVMARSDHWVTVHFLLHGAIALTLTRLQRFLERCSLTTEGTNVCATELLQGSSAASSAPAHALAAISAMLLDDRALLARAQALPPEAALELMRGSSPAIEAALSAYLDRFGHGVAGRYEFIVPTVAERPSVLAPLILGGGADPARGAKRAERARHLEREILAGLPNQEARTRFRAVVDAARRAYGARDDNVQITFNDGFGVGRRALLAMGARFAARGLLADREDIFFLTISESLAALRGRSTPNRALVEQRRARWRDAAARPPASGFGRRIPVVAFAGLPAEARLANQSIVGYMREIMASPEVYGTPDAGEPELRGVGAVGGRYTGIARVLTSSEDGDRLQPGDVLVCPITSPAWAAILPLAGALVTDHGGILSHPAVIAREFGIPAVVATRRATRVIADGARVEVDGAAGTVRVVA